MRRNWAVVAAVGMFIGVCAGTACSTTAVQSGASIRQEFASCIVDGGGTIGAEFELAVADGIALAVIGPGVGADDDLLEQCFEAVNG